MKIVLVILQLLYFVLTQDDPANPMMYALPLNLPDQNQDGQSDNHDFQRAFLGLHLTRYEISQLFEVCDINRDGKISQVEWSNFYNTFIQPFEEAQKEPRDGLLNADELVAAFQDMEKIKALFAAEPDKDYLHKVMETLTSRIKPTMGDEDKLSLNINEYIFFRRSAVAWSQCTQSKGFISRSSIQSCAQSIMLPNINFSENQQQVFFSSLSQYSRDGEMVSGMYKFLTFVSVFHKYDMFKRIGQNKMISGVLNYRELSQACQDSEGPSQKLNMVILDSIFGKLHQNLEFTGFDFRQFYILMQSIDLIYIHGVKQVSVMNPTVIYSLKKEFEILMDQQIYPRNIVDNIDDCKMDIQEELEKPDKKTLWSEQKLLSQQYKRRKSLRFAQKNNRFLQKKDDNIEKLMPKNIEARNFTFNIFDLNQDGLLNAGELYQFHKFSIFFQQLVQGNIHLIYQRNLDLNTNIQMKNFQLSLLKEEINELQALQRWLRGLNKYNDVAINWLQFASHFFYKHHFKINGQQSATSTFVPFPSFVRVLMHLGMQLHREDIVNAVYYNEKNPAILPAQRFDLEAYMRDGASVDFEQAWHKSTLRWSKSFMRKKFFEIGRKRLFRK